jgi:endonuclease/exonuclease/phosphatase family metal-dependent hydrolase
MRLNMFLAIVLLALTLVSYAQKKQANQFKIAFYNTENLFDTINDPNKSDEDFLPGAKVAWTTTRYIAKLDHIAKALSSIDSVDLPAIIGLAEIENIGVLNDLITRTRLKDGNYQAILEEGSDPRGIDVAMIFRKDVMKYLGHRAFPSALSFKTRSVLYVRLADARQDTFHLFVNHWKSRSGGATETEPQRMENATTLKHITDSLLSKNPKSRIVIMGDLNDEPGNKSLTEALLALKPVKKPAPASLYNLMYDRFLNGEGTLYYKDWDLFDQFIVSGNLLGKKPGKGAVILPPYAYIFKPDWLLYKSKTGEMVPNRTASAKDYFGGYSDHLPVYVVVTP